MCMLLHGNNVHEFHTLKKERENSRANNPSCKRKIDALVARTWDPTGLPQTRKLCHSYQNNYITFFTLTKKVYGLFVASSLLTNLEIGARTLEI